MDLATQQYLRMEKENIDPQFLAWTKALNAPQKTHKPCGKTSIDFRVPLNDITLQYNKKTSSCVTKHNIPLSNVKTSHNSPSNSRGASHKALRNIR